MPSIETITSLQTKLQLLPRGSLVGVEGFMGSGKTSLATALAEALGGLGIHTDDILEDEDESRPYVARLNLEKLKSILSNPRKDLALLLIEGICLRETLKKIGIVPATYVYVKLIAKNGLWHDGLNLEGFEQQEFPDFGVLTRSDFQYHSIDRPHEIANYIVCRKE